MVSCMSDTPAVYNVSYEVFKKKINQGESPIKLYHWNLTND